MNKNYPHLFTPLRIGKVVFKNRLFTSPTHQVLQANERTPTEAVINHYANKAKGGAAVVTLGGTNVLKGHEVFPFWVDYDIHSEFSMRYFAQLADTVHFYGSKVSIEISHGPSASDVNEMDEAEMESIAESYVDAAVWLRRAGFDMLLLHGGHGQGLEQFVSPLFNKRTDKYGSSMENRARFPLMVIDRVRQKVGGDLLIEYRISGTEYTPGGLEINDCIEFVKLIEDKIDLIHVSFKYSLKNFKEYLLSQVKKSGIKLRLNSSVTPELLKDEDADIVIVAIGAESILPPIPGMDMGSVVLAPEVFGNTEQIGKRVAVIGGGQVGCETGLYLAELGHEVVIVEMQETIAPDAAFTHRIPLVEKMDESLKYITDARCTKITDSGIRFVDKDGIEKDIDAESVLVAAGMKARTAEADSFFESAPEVIAVGDCIEAKNVKFAVRTAFDAAVRL